MDKLENDLLNKDKIKKFLKQYNEENGFEKKIKVLERTPEGSYSLEFFDEGHTLGNLLYVQLQKDPRVSLCTYRIPHPTQNSFVLNLVLKDDFKFSEVFSDAIKVLVKLAKSSIEEYHKVYSSSFN